LRIVDWINFSTVDYFQPIKMKQILFVLVLITTALAGLPSFEAGTGPANPPFPKFEPGNCKLDCNAFAVSTSLGCKNKEIQDIHYSNSGLGLNSPPSNSEDDCLERYQHQVQESQTLTPKQGKEFGLSTAGPPRSVFIDQAASICECKLPSSTSQPPASKPVKIGAKGLEVKAQELESKAEELENQASLLENSFE
jgi:hypothetical protein